MTKNWAHHLADDRHPWSQTVACFTNPEADIWALGIVVLIGSRTLIANVSIDLHSGEANEMIRDLGGEIVS